MNTHPLSLYEIVLTIGQFIPLWESVYSVDEDLWLFTPKDLLAAISVNRLFHATLTPLLWSVYVESAVKSLGDPNIFECPEDCNIPFDVVKKNSSYIRFLDLSSRWTRYNLEVRLLELNCSRLQELRLSASVDCTWAKRVILANPELRVLHWARPRPRKNLTGEELKAIGSVLSLGRLRYLGLDNWIIFTQYLYSTLAKNAGHLEELHLTRCNSIIAKRSKRDDTGKSQMSFITSREEGVEEFEAMKRRCGRIRLAKLKTLHLDVEYYSCELTLYWLVDIVPALETVVFGKLLGSTAKALSLAMRKSCPRLQKIQQGNFWYEDEDIWRRPRKRVDTALHLANACAPGRFVHASLDGWRIDNTFVEALSLHRDSLETLELAIRNNNYRESFNNLGTILERCNRLKHLAVYFYKYRGLCDHRKPLLFLDKLSTCPSLESLVFHGFTLMDYDNHLHESGDDYGSDEGMLRVRIDGKQEFDDYDPEANIFHGPGWHESILMGVGADECRGECCDHFKRLVGEAIGSLSSLKRVEFGVFKYVKVLS